LPLISNPFNSTGCKTIDLKAHGYQSDEDFENIRYPVHNMENTDGYGSDLRKEQKQNQDEFG